MNPVNVTEGQLPLILAQPHGGTWLPEDIFNRLNDKGKALADTDWHIHTLYNALIEDITIVESQVHRYVIDANRGTQDESLYPGQNTTGLCPSTDFDGNPIYKHNQQPDTDEINSRLTSYHQPYHNALREQIERLKKIHGVIILYDCHSIRSEIPFLFEGILPDFNIGTYNGKSCDQQIAHTVFKLCDQAQGFSTIVNGRFKGGWTTRHYGQPNNGVHAIQMELAQSTYMQEAPPWSYLNRKSNLVRKTLGLILNELNHVAVKMNAGPSLNPRPLNT